MRVICSLLGIILMGLAVYHYKNGYVRGWAIIRENKKWARADHPVVFWTILVVEIAGGVYLFILAAS